MLNPACVESIGHITHVYTLQNYNRGVSVSLAVTERAIHGKLLRVHKNAAYSEAEYLKVLLVQQLLILPGECTQGQEVT